MEGRNAHVIISPIRKEKAKEPKEPKGGEKPPVAPPVQ